MHRESYQAIMLYGHITHMIKNKRKTTAEFIDNIYDDCSALGMTLTEATRLKTAVLGDLRYSSECQRVATSSSSLEH